MINYIIFGLIIIFVIPLCVYIYRKSKNPGRDYDEPTMDDASQHRAD
jgi:uncharacterized protein YpmB